MKAEADSLAADAMDGVKASILHHGDTIEVTAVGAAVKKVADPTPSACKLWSRSRTANRSARSRAISVWLAPGTS